MHAREDRSGAEEPQLLSEGEVSQLNRSELQGDVGGVLDSVQQLRLVQAATRHLSTVRAAVALAPRDPHRLQPLHVRGCTVHGQRQQAEPAEREGEKGAVERRYRCCGAASIALPTRRLKRAADGASAVDRVEARESKNRVRHHHERSCRLQAEPLNPAERRGSGEALPVMSGHLARREMERVELY